MTVYPDLKKARNRLLAAGILLLAILVLGTTPDRIQFFRSYLIAYLFWLGIALGSLSFLMLHHLTGGDWGRVIRRALESAAGTLLWLVPFFLPLVFGLNHLYGWAGSQDLDPHKQVYFGREFFLARAVFYFACWIAAARLLNRWSLEQDSDQKPDSRRFQVLSGPGLLVYGLTVTFASIDWAMSLEARWFSTIYGVLFILGQALSGLAFAVAAVIALVPEESSAEILSPSRLQDLGNLLFAFVMLWAYVNFSQFLILWSGNLAEEAPWILSRAKGGWKFLGILLVVFHFFVPFALLLSRNVKRRAGALLAVSLLIVALRFADLFWLIAPSFENPGPLRWTDAAAFAGLGALWCAAFLQGIRNKPLEPLNDPRYVRSV